MFAQHGRAVVAADEEKEKERDFSLYFYNTAQFRT